MPLFDRQHSSICVLVRNCSTSSSDSTSDPASKREWCRGGSLRQWIYEGQTNRDGEQRPQRGACDPLSATVPIVPRQRNTQSIPGHYGRPGRGRSWPQSACSVSGVVSGEVYVIWRYDSRRRRCSQAAHSWKRQPLGWTIEHHLHESCFTGILVSKTQQYSKIPSFDGSIQKAAHIASINCIRQGGQ